MIKLNQLICGDAAKEMQLLPDSSIDLVIADPPYNLGKDYGNNRDMRQWSDYEHFTRQWLTEAVRVLKPSGTIYIFMGVRFISKLFLFLEDEFHLWLTAGLHGTTHRGWAEKKVFSTARRHIVFHKI
jgi:site-specific DNA-methyltransferase (adenine-specific)